jgi:Ca2+-binding RTX toxin-like protein
MSETARLRSVETAFVSGVAGPVAIQGVIIDASRFTGSTTLSGSSLPDVLIGGPRRDRLFGLRGDDELRGGSGSDALDGGPAADACDGGPGADRIPLRITE